MDTPGLPDRVAMLERMAAQQLTLNDLLSEVTARLTQEQGLLAERARHEEQMARLTQTLEAIKDLLDRPNGH
jgi:hypothetical protein